MTSKQTNTFEKELEEIIMMTIVGGGLKVYAEERIIALFQKVVDKACENEQYPLDEMKRINDKFGLDSQEKVQQFVHEVNKRNRTRDQIRASFKDIVSGKIEL